MNFRLAIVFFNKFYQFDKIRQNSTKLSATVGANLFAEGGFL